MVVVAGVFTRLTYYMEDTVQFIIDTITTKLWREREREREGEREKEENRSHIKSISFHALPWQPSEPTTLQVGRGTLLVTAPVLSSRKQRKALVCSPSGRVITMYNRSTSFS